MPAAHRRHHPAVHGGGEDLRSRCVARQLPGLDLLAEVPGAIVQQAGGHRTDMRTRGHALAVGEPHPSQDVPTAHVPTTSPPPTTKIGAAVDLATVDDLVGNDAVVDGAVQCSREPTIVYIRLLGLTNLWEYAVMAHDNGTVSVLDTWEETRRSLVLELAALPSEGDVMQWQRRLAEEIASAERPPVGVSRVDAKRHLHLLRVITDGLVHKLLDDHFIRTLSRHPGKPASLSGQGADFEFVLDQADLLHRRGVIPIVADLTTLIGVGDIVGLTPGGAAMVLECKNRSAPTRLPTTGRLARQRIRGENLEKYLTNSSIDEGDLTRIAITMPLPLPDWESVANLLDRCEDSPNGTAVSLFGPNDLLVAATSQSEPEQVWAVVSENIHSAQPAVAFYSELIDTASYRMMAPSSYPVQAEQRWRLLEGDLQLFRFVDMDVFSSKFEHNGSSITLAPHRTAEGYNLRIDVDGDEFASLTNQIAEYCAWMPVPLVAMRETIINHARDLIDRQENLLKLSTAYK